VHKSTRSKCTSQGFENGVLRINGFFSGGFRGGGYLKAECEDRQAGGQAPAHRKISHRFVSYIVLRMSYVVKRIWLFLPLTYVCGSVTRAINCGANYVVWSFR